MQVFSLLYITGICLVSAIDDKLVFVPKSESVDFLSGHYLTPNLEETGTPLYLRDIAAGTSRDESVKADVDISRQVVQTTCAFRKKRRLGGLRLYRTRHTAPTPEPCYPWGGADVAIILDSSTSQGQTRFESQKEYIKSFISTFPIGTADFRFSVLSASTSATVHFDLNTHLTNVSVLLQAVDDIQFTGGASKVHFAMDAVTNQVFNGTRTKPRYVISLHDGLLSSPSDTIYEAYLMKINGVTMVSVGFGDQILHQALIDTAHDYSHVFSPTTEDLKHWMFAKHVLSNCQDCPVKSADIFILLETSSDLGITKLYTLMDAIKTLLGSSPISENGVHVSFANFTDTVTERYDFVTHYTSDDAITAAITTTLETRTSNYTNALRHAKDNVFTTTNGYRLGSRKIVILFISESITELSSVLQQANSLKSDNATVVVVSVALTTRTDISSLQQIVSDPAYLFVLGDSIYGDFSTLYVLLSMFQYSECILD